MDDDKNGAMDPGELTELHRTLVEGWSVSPVPAQSLSWDDLVDTLTRRVAFLLENDFHRLTTAMYLLDVSEKRFRQAMRSRTAGNRARDIATLILDREQEKMMTRRKYMRESSVDVSFQENGPEGIEDDRGEEKTNS